MKKLTNIVSMLLFWVSFFIFCYPFATEMKGNKAIDLFIVGFMGATMFCVIWAFTVDCWMEKTK